MQIVQYPRAAVAGINAKDAPIVAAALEASATHVVTGDRRLLAELRKLKSGAPSAVTPREMLELLLTPG